MRGRAKRGSVRVRLWNAIVELVFEQGVAGLGMTMVARRAGCATSAPYKIWESIEAAVAEVAAGESIAMASRARRAAGAVGNADALDKVIAAVGSLVADALARPGAAMLVRANHSFLDLDGSGAPGSMRPDMLGDLFRDMGLSVAREAGRPDVGHLFAWAVAAMAYGILGEAVRQRTQLGRNELVERARAAMAGLMVGMLRRMQT